MSPYHLYHNITFHKQHAALRAKEHHNRMCNPCYAVNLHATTCHLEHSHARISTPHNGTGDAGKPQQYTGQVVKAMYDSPPGIY